MFGVFSMPGIRSLGVIQQAARVAVVGELLPPLLPHLSVAMRHRIPQSFRERIEDVMLLGDERPFPEQFQSAFLIAANRYLNASVSLLACID